MTTFINIHTLISHPSSLMNRDDSGMQKTAVFGGETRVRISSQCLKRAIRKSEQYQACVEEVSIRTNKFDELLALCIEKLPDSEPELIEKVLENLGSKVKKEKDKETGATKRVFDAVQPFSIGAIREAILQVKAGTELKEVKKIPQIPTMDVALSGRMDASCPERNVEAAMSVAHSLTTHPADIEIDWFTACDDLAEQGSGHIGTTEFSSGVFYRYAAINLDLLAENTHSSVEDLAPIVQTMIQCFAQVTPSAKQKTLAAPTYADFVLVTKANQPLSLANAFIDPIENNGKVMKRSIQSLIDHYETLVNGYELESTAIGFDTTQTLNSEQIQAVSKLSEIRFF